MSPDDLVSRDEVVPARVRVALVRAHPGIRYARLALMSERDVFTLKRMGAGAVRALRAALALRGLAFFEPMKLRDPVSREREACAALAAEMGSEQIAAAIRGRA